MKDRYFVDEEYRKMVDKKLREVEEDTSGRTYTMEEVEKKIMRRLNELIYENNRI